MVGVLVQTAAGGSLVTPTLVYDDLSMDVQVALDPIDRNIVLVLANLFGPVYICINY